MPSNTFYGNESNKCCVTIIIIVHKARRKRLIVDVAIPGDQNIVKKEVEKIMGMWDMETDTVLEIVSRHVSHCLKEMGTNDK